MSSTNFSPKSDEYYVIRAMHSYKCLNIPDTSDKWIFQMPYTGRDDQLFRFEPTDGPNYKIVNKKSGKVLQLASESNAELIFLNQGAWNNKTHQQWAIKSQGNGFHAIINKHSKKGIDISGKKMEDGVRALQYTNSSAPNQLFEIVPRSYFGAKLKGGHVEIPHHANYNFGKKEFTVMAFIKPLKDNQLINGEIISKKSNEGGTNNGGWQLSVNKVGKNFMLRFSVDDGFNFSAIEAPIDNLYSDYSAKPMYFKQYGHFVAAVRETDGTMKLYANGYLLSSLPFIDKKDNDGIMNFEFQTALNRRVDLHSSSGISFLKLERVTNGEHSTENVYGINQEAGGNPVDSKIGFSSMNSRTVLARAPYEAVHYLENKSINQPSSDYPAEDFKPIREQGIITIPQDKRVKKISVNGKGLKSEGERQTPMIIKLKTDDYLLGTYAASGANPLLINNNAPIKIGTTDARIKAYRKEEAQQKYEGFVKNVSIWKFGLTQSQIIDYMNQEEDPANSEKCVGYWKLDSVKLKRDSNYFIDSSSIKNDGKQVGDIDLETLTQNGDMLLPFEMEQQLLDNWCWSATTVSTAKFYNPSTNWTQCKLATEHPKKVRAAGIKDKNYTNLDGNACQMPLKFNFGGYVSLAMQITKNYLPWKNSHISFNQCVEQINEGKPIGTGVSWSTSGGHAMAIVGASQKKGADGKVKSLVTIADPWGGTTKMLYEDYKNRYHNPGDTWDATYFTNPFSPTTEEDKIIIEKQDALLRTTA